MTTDGPSSDGPTDPRVVKTLRRRLVTVTAAVVILTGTLLHFIYEWSGRNALVAFVSPVNESVWEHTKLLVVPVTAVAVVEAVVFKGRLRRVAWATLVECVLGALAIVAIFYAYTGALGVGPVLWVDISSFAVVVVAGQWLNVRMLLSPDPRIPALLVSLLGLGVLVALYALWTVAPPDLPVFRSG